MEIVYPRSCGVDVHKSFIVAVICISESVKPKYIKKRFSTFNNQLIQFRDWLIENNCQNVCMESTGKYYIPVYNALEGHISNVVVANPKWVKAIKGEKDDNKDAKWIADLFKFGIVDPAISLKRISASSGIYPLSV
ncbi:transposase [Catenibacterium mitsuokai]|uniref:IS110 family transposase n=1 Tax=Catenibacterium mitsuokai TaxID=100886 RepID=UPI0022044F39|nr:transposase [Catenibacterium mitsuokai]UWO52998.1 transposase [Catenibacterium mitsuokai]UWO53000.1 transposase [Catenibacterium mitsuokai]